MEADSYINEKYPLSDLTGKIIRCAFDVYNTLGNGFQERIYQRALAIEFKAQQIRFQMEFEMPLYYRGEFIGKRRVDFFVEGEVMVELKAVLQLDDAHLAQAINYLEAYNKPVGLLINFGGRSLDFKRVMNKKLNKY